MRKQYTDIYKKADHLVQFYGTRDPVSIAVQSGIYLHDIGGLTDLLGMYTYRNKERHIILNADLDYIHRRMVVAHELGHDSLHRAEAKAGSGLQEFNLFYMRSRMEYEANAFASHILIGNDELLECLKNGYDVVAASNEFEVNINLMLVKLAELNRLGHRFNLPYIPSNDFMGEIGIGRQECNL